MADVNVDIAPAKSVVSETNFGQAPAVGTKSSYAREDHTHGTPPSPSSPDPATTVVSETSFGQAPAVGTDTTYAREDHTHGTPSSPTTINSAGNLLAPLIPTFTNFSQNPGTNSDLTDELSAQLTTDGQTAGAVPPAIITYDLGSSLRIIAYINVNGFNLSAITIDASDDNLNFFFWSTGNLATSAIGKCRYLRFIIYPSGALDMTQCLLRAYLL